MDDLRKNINYDDVDIVNFVNLNDKEKDIVRRWRNSAGVKKWMYSKHAVSAGEHDRFIKRLRHDNKNYYWLVRLKNGSNIGVIYLNRVDRENLNAYLGIYANPDLSQVPSKGDTLMKCIRNVGFKAAGLHTIKLEVLGGNKRAISFYRRNGFTIEGKLKEFVLKNNQREDVIVMGLVNDGRRCD